MKKNTNLQGFTLIEILIVIGLIAILAAVTIISLNPSDNIAAANNSQRQTEIVQILTAIERWEVAGGDKTDLTASTCSDPLGTGTAINDTWVSGLTDPSMSTYLKVIPVDVDGTSYEICDDGTEIVVYSEENKDIFYTR